MNPATASEPSPTESPLIQMIDYSSANATRSAFYFDRIFFVTLLSSVIAALSLIVSRSSIRTPLPSKDAKISRAEARSRRPRFLENHARKRHRGGRVTQYFLSTPELSLSQCIGHATRTKFGSGLRVINKHCYFYK